MARRRRPASGGVLAATLYTAVVGACAVDRAAGLVTTVAPAAPDIFFFLADDLAGGEWGTGASGNTHVHTPAIDAFARAAARFTAMYTPTAMCVPSRAALLSGLYPHRSGVVQNQKWTWNCGSRTIAQYLGPLGYHTAIVGKLHTSPLYTSMDQFAAFDLLKPTVVSKDVKTNAAPWLQGYVDGAHAAWAGHDAGAEVDAADLAWPKPWFLLFSTEQPHAPHNPVPGLEDYEWADDIPGVALPPKLLNSSIMRSELVGQYNSINLLDREFAGFLDAAASRRTASGRRAVLIFASDHGPNEFAKWSSYDAGIRVPFYMQLRGTGFGAGGRRVDHVLSFVDVAPTLFELAGGSEPVNAFDGKSFAALLLTAEPAAAAAVNEYVFALHTNRGIRCGENAYPIRAVTDGKWKYIRNFNHGYALQSHLNNNVYTERSGWQAWLNEVARNTSRAKWTVLYQCRPENELYDLVGDPHEMNNLAAQPAHAPRLRSLRARLQAWMEEQGDTNPVAEELALAPHRSVVESADKRLQGGGGPCVRPSRSHSTCPGTGARWPPASAPATNGRLVLATASSSTEPSDSANWTSSPDVVSIATKCRCPTHPVLYFDPPQPGFVQSRGHFLPGQKGAAATATACAVQCIFQRNCTLFEWSQHQKSCWLATRPVTSVRQAVALQADEAIPHHRSVVYTKRSYGRVADHCASVGLFWQDAPAATSTTTTTDTTTTTATTTLKCLAQPDSRWCVWTPTRWCAELGSESESDKIAIARIRDSCALRCGLARVCATVLTTVAQPRTTTKNMTVTTTTTTATTLPTTTTTTLTTVTTITTTATATTNTNTTTTMSTITATPTDTTTTTTTTTTYTTATSTTTAAITTTTTTAATTTTTTTTITVTSTATTTTAITTKTMGTTATKNTGTATSVASSMATSTAAAVGTTAATKCLAQPDSRWCVWTPTRWCAELGSESESDKTAIARIRDSCALHCGLARVCATALTTVAQPRTTTTKKMTATTTTKATTTTTTIDTTTTIAATTTRTVRTCCGQCFEPALMSHACQVRFAARLLAACWV